MANLTAPPSPYVDRTRTLLAATLPLDEMANRTAPPSPYLDEMANRTAPPSPCAAKARSRLAEARVKVLLAEHKLEELLAKHRIEEAQEQACIERELAEARVAEAQPKFDLSDRAPPVNIQVVQPQPLTALERSIDDVQSEVGSISAPKEPLLRTIEPPYDVGLSTPSQEGSHLATMDENPYAAALPSQEGADPTTKVAHYIGTPETSSDVVFPISFGSEWLVDVPHEVPTPSFTVNQQTIVNNRYDTQLAVESTILEAEQRYQVAITRLAEHANLAHMQQMQEMRREANEALATLAAAAAADRCALVLALQLKENEVTVLRQQSMHDSSSGGASFLDLSSEKDSGHSQPGTLLSLSNPVAPLMNVFSYKTSMSEAPTTVAPPSAGYAGSQASGRSLFRVDLYDLPKSLTSGRVGGALPSQEGSPRADVKHSGALSPQEGAPPAPQPHDVPEMNRLMTTRTIVAPTLTQHGQNPAGSNNPPTYTVGGASSSQGENPSKQPGGKKPREGERGGGGDGGKNNKGALPSQEGSPKDNSPPPPPPDDEDGEDEEEEE